MTPDPGTTRTALALSAGCFVFLAAAHSFLGERLVLQPLFRQQWKLRMHRPWSERLLRFAWHATSGAWVALAAIVLGAPVALVVGWLALAYFLVAFITLRTHLSWPISLVACLSAFWADGWLGTDVARLVALAVAATFAVLGMLHAYWALGGRWARESVVPTRPEGGNVLTIGAVSCSAVATLLFVYSACLFAASFGAPPSALSYLRGVIALGVAVLILRTVGDGRYVGFTKKVRSTAFGRADDRLYTPLVALLAVGSVAALV